MKKIALLFVLLLAATAGFAQTASCPTGSIHCTILNWKAPTDPAVSGYNVYRGTLTGQNTLKVNPAPVTTTTFTDGGPNYVVGVVYFYIVKSVTANGAESIPSNEVSGRSLPLGATELSLSSF